MIELRPERCRESVTCFRVLHKFVGYMGRDLLNELHRLHES